MPSLFISSIVQHKWDDLTSVIAELRVNNTCIVFKEIEIRFAHNSD